MSTNQNTRYSPLQWTPRKFSKVIINILSIFYAFSEHNIIRDFGLQVYYEVKKLIKKF